MCHKEPVKVGVAKDRLIVRGENFQYSSLRVSGDVAPVEIDKFEKVAGKSGSFVDATHAFNVFSYLSTTNSDTAVAKIVNEDGILTVNCKNRQGVVTRFTLTVGSDLLGYDAQISVSKNVFRIMRMQTSLEMLKVGEGLLLYRSPGMEIIQGIRNTEGK